VLDRLTPLEQSVSGLRVNFALDSDSGAIAHFVEQSVLRQGRDKLTDRKDLTNIATFYREHLGQVIVVKDAAGNVVGTGGFKQSKNPSVAEMTRIYVDESMRGKGIGDSLVSEVIKRATSFGYADMNLWVWSQSEAAVALYKKHGFEINKSSASGDWHFMTLSLRPGSLYAKPAAAAAN